MIFGLLKDIKNGEYRTIATPGEIATIVADGHKALVQKGAGERCGFSNEAYEKAGAELVGTVEEIYARAEFVTKVKVLSLVSSVSSAKTRSSSPASIPPRTPRKLTRC